VTLQRSQFLVYQTPDGNLKIDVRFEGETVWLTQQQMAELFQTSVPNVSMHIRNVFGEGELVADSTTAADARATRPETVSRESARKTSAASRLRVRRFSLAYGLNCQGIPRQFN
jgi:hypothetical protein